MGKSRYVVCEVKGELPVYNRKRTFTTLKVVTSVVESEFKGRKYLWWGGETHYGEVGRFKAPTGAIVRFEHVSGSSKHTYYHYIAYFRVVEGVRKTIELENLAGSDKLKLDVVNLEPIGRPDMVVLETDYLNEGYELSRSRRDDNLLAYYALRLFRESSEPRTTAVSMKEEARKDEVLSELKALAEELESEEEEGVEEVKVTKEDIYKYLESRGLVPVRLVTFDLPTEYRGARTEYDKTEDGRVREVKVFSVDPTRYRSLRRKFYAVLERCAFKTTAGWVLRGDADVSELNKVISELNKLAGESRNVWVIEAYMPRDYVINQLEQYIMSRELALKDIEGKLKLEKLKESERKRLERRLSELEEVVRKLREELKRIKS